MKQKNTDVANPVRATNTILAGVFRKFVSNFDNMKALLQPDYELATLLVPEKGNTWLICWYNRHPDTHELERIRKTFDLNRVKNLKERRRLANRYISVINEALRNGYNYFIHTKGIGSTGTTASEMSITVALGYALKQRTVGKAHRTVHSYRSFTTCLCDWLKETKRDTMPVGDFTIFHMQEYLLHKHQQGHKNRNINDHLNYFKTTFDQLRRWKICRENPLTEMDFLPERGSSLFQPLTAEELQIVGTTLLQQDAHFYLYTKLIAYEFIRPYHVARLQRKQIDFERNILHLDAETTKNKLYTQKQLFSAIKGLLISLGMDKLPGDWYLFSKGFRPGPVLHENLSIRAAEKWRQIVIEGLGIDKKMYALKHTAAQYFVNENEHADISWLQQHMEHSSIAQTEIYLQGKVVKRTNEKKTKTIKY